MKKEFLISWNQSGKLISYQLRKTMENKSKGYRCNEDCFIGFLEFDFGSCQSIQALNFKAGSFLATIDLAFCSQRLQFFVCSHGSCWNGSFATGNQIFQRRALTFCIVRNAFDDQLFFSVLLPDLDGHGTPFPAPAALFVVICSDFVEMSSIPLVGFHFKSGHARRVGLYAPLVEKYLEGRLSFRWRKQRTLDDVIGEKFFTTHALPFTLFLYSAISLFSSSFSSLIWRIQNSF